jgi:hypothetical protein
MAENIGKDTGPAEPKPVDQFEQKKQQALESFLEESVGFVRFDNRMNGLLEQLLATVVKQVKDDPGAAFSDRGNMDALINALKSRSEGGSGLSGGDIIGGAPIDDVIALIKEIASVMKDEKDFFMKIIQLIFCGC